MNCSGDKYLHSLLAGESYQCHRAAAGLNAFGLVDATLKCSLHDLVPLINFSQTPPGFGSPLTPA